MSEKKFKIGQVVRIVGPSFFGIELGVGKCFVIGDIITRDGKSVYCDIDRGIGWLASSLELVEPEYDCPQGIRCPYIPKSYRLEMVEQRCMAIEKRLQALESKANSGATTDTPDELPELHVGDYVEVVGQPLVTFGLPVGTIDHVSHSLPPFGWILLECSSLWYPRRSLRKLSDNEIIAKIGWERKA